MLRWSVCLSLSLLATTAWARPAPIRDCRPDSEDECCAEAGMARLEAMAKGRRVMECDRIDRLQGFRTCGTAFQRGHNDVAERCMTGVMQTALASRLQGLRKDPAQRKTEVALQARFEREKTATCAAIEKSEPGASTFPRAHRCRMELTRWRAEQALRIAAGHMALAEAVSEPAATQKGLSFQGFVQGVCTLPEAVWRDHTVPPGCEAALLAEIQLLLGR
jgi:hypothetical protein